jgi:hypothetical protein
MTRAAEFTLKQGIRPCGSGKLLDRKKSEARVSLPQEI